jgi:hypothetical protein
VDDRFDEEIFRGSIAAFRTEEGDEAAKMRRIRPSNQSVRSSSNDSETQRELDPNSGTFTAWGRTDAMDYARG